MSRARRGRAAILLIVAMLGLSGVEPAVGAEVPPAPVMLSFGVEQLEQLPNQPSYHVARWSAVAGVSGYRLWSAVEPDLNDFSVFYDTRRPDDTSYAIIDMSSRSLIHWAVTAYNEAGESPRSNIIADSFPAGYRLPWGNSYSADGVFEWAWFNAYPLIPSFDVFWGPAPGQYTHEIHLAAHAGGGVQSYRIAGPNGVPIYYRVRGVDTYGRVWSTTESSGAPGGIQPPPSTTTTTTTTRPPQSTTTTTTTTTTRPPQSTTTTTTSTTTRPGTSGPTTTVGTTDPPAQEPAPAIGGPSTLVPVSPTRVVDTRSGLGGVQGPLAPNSTTDFQIVGQGGVPGEATSVVLNVTAVDADATGYLTVFATGTARPDASNLNVVAGRNVANLVIARIGTGGKVSVYNFGGNAHVIFDVTGYFVNAAGAGRFHGVVPQRLLDTRVTAAGTPRGGIPAPGQTIAAAISTLPPAQFHATAALVNITVTDPQADGYLSVFPSGEPLPPSSNLNFNAGQTIANAVIVKVGQLTNGWTAINLFNALASTHLIVDLMGIFDDGTNPPGFSNPTAFRTLGQPVRVLDTRTSLTPLAPQETRRVNVSGAGGAPPGAIGVVLNATATNTTADSYLTLWSPVAPQPNASNLNWAAGETIPNLVGTFVAAGGASANQLSVYNDSGTTDVLLDITGYFYPT